MFSHALFPVILTTALQVSCLPYCCHFSNKKMVALPRQPIMVVGPRTSAPDGPQTDLPLTTWAIVVSVLCFLISKCVATIRSGIKVKKNLARCLAHVANEW